MSRNVAARAPRAVVWCLACVLLALVMLAGCATGDDASDTANQPAQSQVATVREDPYEEQPATPDEGQPATPDEEQTARALAKEILARAREVEPAVTQDLKSLEDEAAQLAGLDFRLKGEDSLARKIVSEAHDKEVSLEEASSSIHDVIRYTMCIEPSEYVSKATEALKELESRGYTVTKFKNTWASDIYKGLNTNLSTPDGTVVEIQFHTPESYDVKQQTHEYYEISRSEDATEKEVEEALRMQRKLTGSVHVPNGAIEFEWELE